MTTRQELYDRIRSSSRDEVILEEMIRLGFWPRGDDIPEDPATEIRRRGELEREIRALGSENRRLHNIEAIKKALRKQRMEESRRKRKETKERHLRERQERAEAWRLRKQAEIVYVGEGVSDGLTGRESNQEKLASLRLPVMTTPEDVANTIGISIGELRFLAFSRKTSPVTHYQRFAIKKKTGGVRHISAPMPRLKTAQRWILENVLEQIPLHTAAHGFRRGRSIVTNAEPHVGSAVVLNMDMEDFFPTVTYRRVKGMFRSFGYSESVATILGLLCSEPEVWEVELDGQSYFVGRGDRFLPQGAPTSPAVTNVICRGLDARLTHIAEQLGFCYTRYADDITFSGPAVVLPRIGQALRRIEFVVSEEGFKIHPNKTRVQRQGARREVTGLTVNERVNVPRRLLRRFRATLFQIEKDGPAGKTWGRSNDVIAAIEGFANFVNMVDPAQGQKLMRRVEDIIERYGRGPQHTRHRQRWGAPDPPLPTARGDQSASAGPTSPAPQPSSPTPPPPDAGSSSDSRKPPDPDKPWWKFW